jgi:putative hydrolase of the HAD superfamily
VKERLQAVLFDAAGTLLELREPVGESYARIAAGYGARVPASRLEEAFRRILAAAPPMAFPGEAPAQVAARERAWWRDVVRGTFRAADGAARFTDFEACFETLWRHFASPDAWRLAPGAEAALTALARAGLRLGVLSNFDQRLHGLLAGLGIQDRFEVVVLPADAGAAKPAARIFEVALARLGLPAGAVLYVGDDADHDVAAARAAGLRAVRVSGPATLAGLPVLVAGSSQESA